MYTARLLTLGSTLLLLALALQSCQKESIESSVIGYEKDHCDAVIDFNDLDRGDIVNALASGSGVSGATVSGSIVVYGQNLTIGTPVENRAMIFDTDNPSGGDIDLVIPGRDYQKVMIISEDGDMDDPDDNAPPGGIFTFDFSGFGPGKVDVDEFWALDMEEGGTFQAYAAGNVMVASGDIPKINDREDELVPVGATGVVRLVIRLKGSGAVDNFCLGIEAEEAGCTYTQGYWQNPKKGPWPAPYARENDFFLSGQTWQEVLKTPVKGNAYYQAAHQYIAAVLNSAIASTPPAVDAAIAAATDLFNTYTPAQIKALSGNDPLRQQFVAINDLLDSYNKGDIGPGHCD